MGAPGPAGIVAGSGMDLAGIFDEITQEIPFHSLTGLSEGRVAGHACRFLLGRSGGREVVLQCGRRHAYEGLSYRELTATIDAIRGFGAATIVLTNAAGGLHTDMQPGSLVAATAVRAWPFAGFPLPETQTPERILDCTHAGPHRWMHGPCYETPAEVRALQALGDATVGMSIAPELLRCQELGLEAAVVSCVTNPCGPGVHLSHASVLETAARASGELRALLKAALALA